MQEPIFAFQKHQFDWWIKKIKTFVVEIEYLVYCSNNNNNNNKQRFFWKEKQFLYVITQKQNFSGTFICKSVDLSSCPRVYITLRNEFFISITPTGKL